MSDKMPYTPINRFLNVTEDIRIQHRYSNLANNLSHTTYFNKRETLLLLQIYYMLTTKQNKTMDKSCFVQFMDTFLGHRNIDVIEKMYLLRCRKNKKYLTGKEFVELLSLLLNGSLHDIIKFCFGIYLQLVRSSPYIEKDAILMMARRNNIQMYKLRNVEEHNRNFMEFVMQQVDKDRDDRISLEDYRNAVYEDISRLQILGQVLPTPENIEIFMKLFTTRPYINNLEITPMVQMTKLNYSDVIPIEKHSLEERIKHNSTNSTLFQH